MSETYIKKTLDKGDVYIANSLNFRLTRSDTAKLIDRARVAPFQKARICAHHSVEDSVHEMFIAHNRDAYVRPHKHVNKTESMVILTGEVDYLIFDDEGALSECHRLGEHSSGLPFYQTTRTDLYHSLIVRSDWTVFLEITKGPFEPSDTVWAPWSPSEEETKSRGFREQLEREIIRATKR